MLGQELLKTFPQATGWDRNEIDITDKKQTEEKIAALRPNIVINAAAYNAVDQCETMEGFETAKKINGDASGFLAEICSEISAVFVHYSSNYIFDGNNKEGYNEDSIPKPINKYGETKLLGEEKILKIKGLKYYIIRTSKLFGKKGSSGAAKDNFFDIMLDLSKSQRDIKAVDDELSNFTYAPDLACFTKNILENDNAYGIYHGINEGACTWYEGAKMLFDITGKNVNLIPVNSSEFSRLAQRPKYAVLNNNKLPKLRGYEEALREFLTNKLCAE